MFTDSFQELEQKQEEADSRKAADRLKTTMVYNNARAETKMESDCVYGHRQPRIVWRLNPWANRATGD